MTDETMYYFDDLEFEVLQDILYKYEKNPNKLQHWDVLPKGRVLKIWRDTAKMGFVRDEKGLDDMVYQVIWNIVKLKVNTTLCGHTPSNPLDYFDEQDDINEDELEKLTDTMEDEEGRWLLSDYGLEPLLVLASELYEEKDAEKKLVLLDRIFNVTHRRSDLAKLFIEGGSVTLDELSCSENTLEITG